MNEQRRRANALASKCEDAYSFDRYRTWPGVALELIRLGFSDDDAETIMRSKWTRWAADCSSAEYGRVPARAVREYVEKHREELRFQLGVNPPPMP